MQIKYIPKDSDTNSISSLKILYLNYNPFIAELKRVKWSVAGFHRRDLARLNQTLVKIFNIHIK